MLMSKTVVLINPGDENSRFNIAPPHTIGYIAAYLEKNGISVYIADEVAHQDPFKIINDVKPDYVGITGTTSLINHSYKILERCKKMNIPTVIGGVHVSAMPEEALNYSDFVVLGEGERAMLKIVNELTNDRVIKEPYVNDINEFPMPAWHLYNADFYINFQSNKEHPSGDFLDNYPKGAKIGTVLGSRGCPFDCIFCYNNWREAKLRFHSVDRVIEEIKFLVEKYDVNCIGFTDDNLFASQKRISEISRRIIEMKLNIKWTGTATAKNINPETVKLAKEAGCMSLFFGFESNSPKVLATLKNQKISIDDNWSAVSICDKVGMNYNGSFIFGAPGETEEDINETIKFIKATKMKQFGIAIAVPYPGTKLWEIAKSKELIPKDLDYSKLGKEFIPSFNQDLPIEKLRQFISYAYMEKNYHKSIMELLKLIIRNPGFIVKNIFKIPKFILIYIKSKFSKNH